MKMVIFIRKCGIADNVKVGSPVYFSNEMKFNGQTYHVYILSLISLSLLFLLTERSKNYVLDNPYYW